MATSKNRSINVSPTQQAALVEGAKELGRVVLIAAVSAGIVYLQAKIGGIKDPVEQMVLLTALTSLGKAFDKFVHKDPNTNASGITGF